MGKLDEKVAIVTGAARGFGWPKRSASPRWGRNTAAETDLVEGTAKFFTRFLSVDRTMQA